MNDSKILIVTRLSKKAPVRVNHSLRKSYATGTQTEPFLTTLLRIKIVSYHIVITSIQSDFFWPANIRWTNKHKLGLVLFITWKNSAFPTLSANILSPFNVHFTLKRLWSSHNRHQSILVIFEHAQWDDSHKKGIWYCVTLLHNGAEQLFRPIMQQQHYWLFAGDETDKSPENGTVPA